MCRTVRRNDYELKDEHTVSNHEINMEDHRAQQSGCSSVSVVTSNDPMYMQRVLLKEKETRGQSECLKRWERITFQIYCKVSSKKLGSKKLVNTQPGEMQA